MLHSFQGRLVVILVLFTGAAGAFDSLLMESGLNLFWRAFVFLAAVSLALALVNLPSALYSRFVIEEEFGFNTMKPLLFFADLAKQLVLGAVLLLVVLGGIHTSRILFRQWWWLAAWAFWILFQLLMMVVYPTLIAPLFQQVPALGRRLSENQTGKPCKQERGLPIGAFS